MEKIIQTSTCSNCQQSFSITDRDVAFYEKIDVPFPTWCPACRHLRRHGHINDYVFYLRPCDNCHAEFVSIFPPKSDYIVYCQACWYAEERDDKKSGRDYDPSRSFFEQFDELMHATPQLGIIGMHNQNSTYCESVANCKNCYLISESSNCEDCFYCYWIQKTKDCLDCSYCHECERCYQLTDCFNCYHLLYSRNCSNCSDSYFLDNCANCNNCLFSTNLRFKEYYIFNKPYTKEAYQQELTKLRLGDATYMRNLQQKFNAFLLTVPRRALQMENVENCTGDYIRNAKNCKQVFHCYDAEDCSYGEHIWRGAKDCMDANTAGRNAELIYESTNCGIDSYNVKFSRYCWGGQNVEYSNQCPQSKNLFGCVSLKPGAQYCILNKQYSKKEYEELMSQITQNMKNTPLDLSFRAHPALAEEVEKSSGKDRKDPSTAVGMTPVREYGEFFPLAVSPFGYNTSVSFDDHPFSREEVLAKGWKWEEQESGTRGKGTIDMKTLPTDITQINDTVCNMILTCERCERNYQIIRQEFSFYQQNSIPLPRHCPDCRHRERLSWRNPKKLWQRRCDCTNQEHNHTTNVEPRRGRAQAGRDLPLQEQNRCLTTFQTTYAPDRPEKVYVVVRQSTTGLPVGE